MHVPRPPAPQPPHPEVRRAPGRGYPMPDDTNDERHGTRRRTGRARRRAGEPDVRPDAAPSPGAGGGGGRAGNPREPRGRPAQRRPDLPGHARRHPGVVAHGGLPDLHLLAGAHRRDVRRSAGRSSPQRRPGPGAARRRRCPGHPEGPGVRHGGGRLPGGVVPADHEAPAGHRQPPHPSEGPGVRRAGELQRRRRHRRRVGRRRPRRVGVAGHPLPARGPRDRRPAGGLPRQLGRDVRRALRAGRGPVPGAATGRPQRGPGGARDLGGRSERHHQRPGRAAAAGRGAAVADHRVLRPRRPLPGPAL
jgi:hypothetical protein